MHGEQAMETVLTDTVVFTLLSERKLGPKLHGIFPGGRIEQYIPVRLALGHPSILTQTLPLNLFLFCPTQARPLATQELSEPRISAKIAEKMATIHSLNIPVSKEPEWLWKTMARWLISSESVLANSTAAQTPDDDAGGVHETMRSFDFRSELAWLKQTIEAADYAVVFSHNDMQEGNILFREEVPGGGSTNAQTTTTAAGVESSPMERIQYARMTESERFT